MRLSALAAAGAALVAFCAAAQETSNPLPEEIDDAYEQLDQLCARHEPFRGDFPSGGACEFGSTVNKCYGAIESLPDEELKKADAQNSEEGRKVLLDLAARNVQTPLQLPGFANALPNLLPLAMLGAAQPIVNKLDDPHTLGTVLNEAFIPLGLNAGHLLDVQGKFFLAPSPAVNPVLAAHLADTSRADVLHAADQDSRPWDDMLYEISVTPLSRWFGRDGGWYYSDFDNIASAVTAQTSDAEEADRLKRILRRQPLDDRGQRAARCFAGIHHDEQLRTKKSVTQHHVARFATLVSNQPQIVYSFRGLRRKGAVGANVYSHRLTLSSGLLNNVLYLRASSSCSGKPAADDAAERVRKKQCLDDFDGLVDSGWNLNSLQLAAFYEMGNLATFTFDIPASSILGSIPLPPLPPPLGETLGQAEHFVLEGGRYRTWGASIGMAIPACSGADPLSALGLAAKDKDDEKGEYRNRKPACRIDLAYDRTTYDESVVRADHWVGRLTFTYRIGLVSIPIHLVYQDKTEFNVDVANRFGAAIGTGVSW